MALLIELLQVVSFLGLQKLYEMFIRVFVKAISLVQTA